MDRFLSLVVSGGVSGAIFSLLAIGLVVSYSTSRIFNFGHGGTAFATAYLFYQFHTGLGWSVPFALIATVVVFAPLAGYVWDRLVFRRLAGASEAAKITAGVGVLIVMPALTVYVCDELRSAGLGFLDTSQAFSVPGVGPTPAHLYHPRSGLVVTSDQIIVLGVGLVAFLALSFLLRYSTLGLRMRTAVDSPELARLRGVNTGRISSISWVMSFALAGLAGVLAAPFPGPFGLNSNNYTLALFVAATAAVVAGLRSVPVAFAAGILVGALRNLSQGYLDASHAGAVGRWIAGVYGLQASLPYWVLFIALIFVKFSRGRRSAGTSNSAPPPPDYLVDLPKWRQALPWVISGAVLLFYGLVLADAVWRNIVMLGLATALIFLSFTIVTGLGGMISLAQAAFAGVGALTAGALAAQGWPLVPAALAGAAVAMLLGLLVALPALRVGGLSLTLASLTLALLCGAVLFQIERLANGATGWHLGRPLGLTNDRAYIVVLLGLVVAVSFLVNNLASSAWGRAMVAVRTAEPAAAASAVSPAFMKLGIFGVSALVAGFGGVLVATVDGTVTNLTFPPTVGFIWLAVVVIFGVDRPQSAVVAALVFEGLPRILSAGIHVGSFGWDGTSSQLLPQLLFGLGAIGLAKRPHGVLSQFAQRQFAFRARRRAGPTTKSVASPTVAAAAFAAPAADAVLVLQDVHAGYGELEVLHGVNLTVRDGQALALLGANGAGKSTLTAVIAGLVPVTAGRILFQGEDITRMTASARARQGLVLVPESRGIFPTVSVEDNLKLWLSSAADINSVFERFPILEKRRRQPAGNLSGGEQQMLSIAPLLARRPALLISDEPTLGLSPMASAQLMGTFAEARAAGTNLLLVEEKARDVLTVVDEVGALSRGELLWVCAKAEVDRERIASAYLGLAPATAVPSVIDVATAPSDAVERLRRSRRSVGSAG